MKEITLEMVDKVKERTGVSYKVAKEALEMCHGEVLDAIIYLESNIIITTETLNSKGKESDNGETIDEFKTWIKELIEKGNVSRIKIRKDEKVLVDVPVNAGIAATVIAVVLPPVLAFGVIAAVATKITIEITREDGTVEIVNRYVSKAAEEVKDKASGLFGTLKNKISDVKSEMKKEEKTKEKVYRGEETVYTYTVNFENEEN